MEDLVTRFALRTDLHQSPMHRDLMRRIGWETIKLGGAQLFLRKIGPLVVAKVQRPQTLDLEKLNQIRQERHIFTLYIEPGLGEKEKLGWTVEPFAHSATSLIDLSRTEAELLNSFSQKTRYNIVHELKKNTLTIRSTPLNKLAQKERDYFFELRRAWSKRKHLVGYSEELLQAVFASYRDHAVLHSAYHGDMLVATLLILYHDRVATYWAALATEEGYHHFAPTLLTWRAIQVAKESGCDIFDFGGIYDERYPKMYKKWQGFTKFKEGFRPTKLLYPPTYLKLFW